MRLIRPAIAVDPRLFGRRGLELVDESKGESSTLEDMKLFATTFEIGCLFVSVLIISAPPAGCAGAERPHFRKNCSGCSKDWPRTLVLGSGTWLLPAEE